MNTQPSIHNTPSDDPFVRAYAKQTLKQYPDLNVTEDELYNAFMEVAQKTVIGNENGHITLKKFYERKASEGGITADGKLRISFCADTDGTLNDHPLIKKQQERVADVPPTIPVQAEPISGQPAEPTVYEKYEAYLKEKGATSFSKADPDDALRLTAIQHAMETLKDYVEFSPAPQRTAEMRLMRSHKQEGNALAEAVMPSPANHETYPYAQDIMTFDYDAKHLSNEQKINAYTAVYVHEMLHTLGIHHIDEKTYSAQTQTTLHKINKHVLTAMGSHLHTGIGVTFIDDDRLFKQLSGKEYNGKLLVLDRFMLDYTTFLRTGKQPELQTENTATTELTLPLKEGATVPWHLTSAFNLNNPPHLDKLIVPATMIQDAVNNPETKNAFYYPGLSEHFNLRASYEYIKTTEINFPTFNKDVKLGMFGAISEDKKARDVSFKYNFESSPDNTYSRKIQFILPNTIKNAQTINIESNHEKIQNTELSLHFGQAIGLSTNKKFYLQQNNNTLEIFASHTDFFTDKNIVFRTTLEHQKSSSKSIELLFTVNGEVKNITISPQDLKEISKVKSLFEGIGINYSNTLPEEFKKQQEARQK